MVRHTLKMLLIALAASCALGATAEAAPGRTVHPRARHSSRVTSGSSAAASRHPAAKRRAAASAASRRAQARASAAGKAATRRAATARRSATTKPR